ncbi:MAG TPA: nucleotide exchange factor GrpE [Guyparkeria sp.]|nr:nucleotide exchange factor GrpE [Guyparkeria sp.]HZJ81657.1 nucleotide exchange factor GrpE [Guyparkeria sp.]
MTDRPVDQDGLNQEHSEPPVESEEQTGDAGEVTELRAALAEKEEEILRMAAEMQNLRRRAERDIESARKFALERFVEGLLPVIDSLELGIAATEQDNATLEKIKEGGEMTLKMLLQTLDRFGVQPVDPVGERFNPDHHQAMSTQPHEGEPDHVVDVMQKGYLLNDRVVRPALVVVSKPKQE